MPQNPYTRVQIANLRTSQQSWGAVKDVMTNRLYAVGLLRSFYKQFVANANSSGALTDNPDTADINEGTITQEETDMLLNMTFPQVLPTDNPDTPFDESVSIQQFIEWHNQYLDPGAAEGTFTIGLDLADVENPEQIIDSRLSDIAGIVAQLLGLRDMAQYEIEAIDSKVKDLEILQENEARAI